MGRHEQHAALWGRKAARTTEATHVTTSTKVARVPELFSLEEEPGGGRPAPLPEVAGRQVRLEAAIWELVCPFVQILDLPVPQMVDFVADALRILDLPMAAQVIEVPKISQDIIPQRSVDLVPQLVEQLVEVPTVLSPLRIAEQIVGTPVPRGRGQRRVQGFLPRQSPTATPSSVERISERTVEQIVDISPGGGLGQASASSAGATDEEFTGGFSHLSPMEKSAECRAGGECAAGWHVSSSTLSARQMARAGEPVVSDGSDEWVLMRDGDTGQTFYWNRRTDSTAWDAPAGCRGRLGRGEECKSFCVVLEPGHWSHCA